MGNEVAAMRDLETQRARWRDACRSDAPKTIVYRDGSRRMELVLHHDAAVELREYGGPHYLMGAVANTCEPTVRAWRGQAEGDLYGEVFEALVSAQFPVPEKVYSPSPGEPPNLIAVHTGEASAQMATLFRMRVDIPALDQVERRLGALCYSLSQTPNHTIANPDAEDWKLVGGAGPHWPLSKSADRRPEGPRASRPAPGKLDDVLRGLALAIVCGAFAGVVMTLV